MGPGFAFFDQSEEVAIHCLGEEEHGGIDDSADGDEDKDIPVFDQLIGGGLEIVDGGAHDESGKGDLGDVFEIEIKFEVILGGDEGTDEDAEFAHYAGGGGPTETVLRDKNGVTDEVEGDTNGVDIEQFVLLIDGDEDEGKEDIEKLKK